MSSMPRCLLSAKVPGGVDHEDHESDHEDVRDTVEVQSDEKEENNCNFNPSSLGLLLES